jgi:signal transduction histidine kinase
MVRANAAQLRLVLSNLVINAAEAVTDGPGRLEVTVRTVAAADLPAANRFPVDWQPTAPAYACLQVADNGSGIDPDDIDQLFDPFFTSKFTGRGLGLAVVLGVVKAGGGAVAVTSEAGRGSVFAVYLPLAGPGGETRPAAA